MRFDHPEYEEVWFTVKDEPTNRDVLMYDSEITGNMTASLYQRLWAGAKWLILEWHCDYLSPESSAEDVLNGAYNAQLVETLKWAALAVFSFRQSLEPQKN